MDDVKAGVEASGISYSKVVKEYAEAGDIAKAGQLLCMMLKARIEADSISHNSAITIYMC